MNDLVELFLQKTQVIQSSDHLLELLLNFRCFLLCNFGDRLSPFWLVMNLRLFAVILSKTVIEEIYVFTDLVFQNGVEFVFDELAEFVGKGGLVFMGDHFDSLEQKLKGFVK